MWSSVPKFMCTFHKSRECFNLSCDVQNLEKYRSGGAWSPRWWNRNDQGLPITWIDLDFDKFSYVPYSSTIKPTNFAQQYTIAISVIIGDHLSPEMYVELLHLRLRHCQGPHPILKIDLNKSVATIVSTYMFLCFWDITDEFQQLHTVVLMRGAPLWYSLEHFVTSLLC